LTRPFRLAYTPFIGQKEDFPTSASNTHIFMTFLAYIARFLFWLLVASWAIRLLRRFVGWMLSSAATAGQQTPEAASADDGRAARRLVRDPICGMHVDETLSIPFRDEGELLHFCSNTCRDKYAGRVRKFAANG
jgi:YHS domain-containing protein